MMKVKTIIIVSEFKSHIIYQDLIKYYWRILMSADNGIYILKCKDQNRVIHTQAIENLHWSYITQNSQEYLVPTRIIEYFGTSKFTRDIRKAVNVAQIMAKNYPILEYGIQIIPCEKTWKQIEREAKLIAVEERKRLVPESNYNKYIIEELNKIIERKCS
jgi:hypothetical protein